MKGNFVFYCLFKLEIMIYGIFMLNNYSKNYLYSFNSGYNGLRYIKCKSWNILSINIRKCVVATGYLLKFFEGSYH